MSAPVRTVSATTTGSPARRCARWSKNRNDGSSAQCASSTASTSGPRSVRFTTSQYKPCNVANATPPVPSESDTSVNTGSANRAAPANSRSRSVAAAPTSAASSSWRTTPNPKPRSSSPPRAVCTVIAKAQARLRKLIEQSGLADTRRALDQQDAARSPDRFGERGIDRGEVVLTVEKLVCGPLDPGKDFGRHFGPQLCRKPPFPTMIFYMRALRLVSRS